MSGKPSSQSCESKLVVVTGRGRHSHHGVARLRPAVIAFLNANHYQYVISLLQQHSLRVNELSLQQITTHTHRFVDERMKYGS